MLPRPIETPQAGLSPSSHRYHMPHVAQILASRNPWATQPSVHDQNLHKRSDTYVGISSRSEDWHTLSSTTFNQSLYITLHACTGNRRRQLLQRRIRRASAPTNEIVTHELGTNEWLPDRDDIMAAALATMRQHCWNSYIYLSRCITRMWVA